MLVHGSNQMEPSIIHLVRNAHFVVMCSDSHARLLHPKITTTINIIAALI